MCCVGDTALNTGARHEDVSDHQKPDQPLHLDRHWKRKYVDRCVRPIDREGQRNAEDCTGSTYEWSDGCEQSDCIGKRRAAKAAREIVKAEPGTTHALFQGRTKEVEQQHVEYEVEEPTVYEHVCEKRPPANAHLGRVECQEVGDPGSSEHCDREEIHDHVGHDEPFDPRSERKRRLTRL